MPAAKISRICGRIRLARALHNGRALPRRMCAGSFLSPEGFPCELGSRMSDESKGTDARVAARAATQAAKAAHRTELRTVARLANRIADLRAEMIEAQSREMAASVAYTEALTAELEIERSTAAVAS